MQQIFQATLATQMADPAHMQQQERLAVLLHPAHGIPNGTLGAGHRIRQSRQASNRDFPVQSPAVTGKINTIDQRPCKHEARMIYIPPSPVKDTAQGTS
ncbi:hypothetical protein TK5_17800 [Sideroxyarcus sp. TK5]